MAEETPMTVKLDYIQRDIKEIKEQLEHEYVTKEEFLPIQRLVFGLVSLILLSVFTALVSLVLKK